MPHGLAHSDRAFNRKEVPSEKTDKFSIIESGKEVFEASKEISVAVDKSAIERVRNFLDRANLVDKLDQNAELTEKDRERIGGMVRDRSWFGLFNDLSAGDKMAYFSAPGGAFSVKNLNTLFGEQLTDMIIDNRKKILSELMSGSGHEILTQDYRSASFKLKEKGQDGLEKELNGVAELLNERMVEVISKAIDRRILEGMDEKKFSQMRTLLQSTEVGFRMNFGMSEVPEATDETDKSNAVQALSECAQMAQLSRHLTAGRYGETYDRSAVIKEISGGRENEGVNELGNKLADKTIIDRAGIEYKVFEMKDRRRVMNRDLLRLVRKKDFVPQEGQEDLFNQVEQYTRRINILDLVKPYTAGEIAGGMVSRQVDKLNQFVEKDEQGKYVLRDGLSQIDKMRLASELKRDQKDSTYDAPEMFHKEAMKLKDCVYINLDVLDLGVDLLLEYEQLIQEVGDDDEKLKTASLNAGDKITESMRAVRAKALDVFNKYFPGVKPIDRVGGDEISLAVEDPQNPKLFEQFLLELQHETGTRVVKTVVGGAERHSNHDFSAGDGEVNDEVVAEHLVAIKRAERGSEICKKIEKQMRLAELVLHQVKGISAGDEAAINQELSRMEINQFKNIAVVERGPGDLKVVCWRDNGKDIEERSLEDVVKWIGQKIAIVANKR